MTNPYEVLGLPEDASEIDVKSAYRRLAKSYHPDLNQGSPHSSSRFREITEAYAILSDAEQRRAYDEGKQVSQTVVDDAVGVVMAAIRAVEQEAAEAQRAARGYATRGIFWLIGGLAVSLFSFLAASGSDGGTYYVFWGAIIFGGIQAIRGFSTSAKIERVAQEMRSELWNSVTNIR